MRIFFLRQHLFTVFFAFLFVVVESRGRGIGELIIIARQQVNFDSAFPLAGIHVFQIDVANAVTVTAATFTTTRFRSGSTLVLAAK